MGTTTRPLVSTYPLYPEESFTQDKPLEKSLASKKSLSIVIKVFPFFTTSFPLLFTLTFILEPYCNNFLLICIEGRFLLIMRLPSGSISGSSRFASERYPSAFTYPQELAYLRFSLNLAVPPMKSEI